MIRRRQWDKCSTLNNVSECITSVNRSVPRNDDNDGCNLAADVTFNDLNAFALRQVFADRRDHHAQS